MLELSGSALNRFISSIESNVNLLHSSVRAKLPALVGALPWLQSLLKNQFACLAIWIRWCLKQALLFDFVKDSVTYVRSFPDHFSKDPPLLSNARSPSVSRAGLPAPSIARAASLVSGARSAVILASKCMQSPYLSTVNPQAFASVCQLGTQMISELSK